MGLHNNFKNFIKEQHQFNNQLGSILKVDGRNKDDDQALKKYLQYGIRSQVSDQLELDQRSAAASYLNFLEKFRRFVRSRIERENLEYQNFYEKQKLKNQKEQEDAFDSVHRQSSKAERQNLLQSTRNILRELLELLVRYKNVAQKSLSAVSNKINHVQREQRDIINKRVNPLLNRWKANLQAKGYVYRPQRPSAPSASFAPAFDAFFNYILPQQLKEGALTEDNIDHYIQSLQNPSHQLPQPVPSAPSADDIVDKQEQQQVQAPQGRGVDQEDKQQASYEVAKKQDVQRAPDQSSAEAAFSFADSLRKHPRTKELFSDFSAEESDEYSKQVGQAISTEYSEDAALREAIHRSLIDFQRNENALSILTELRTVLQDQQDSFKAQQSESESALQNLDSYTNDQLYEIEHTVHTQIVYFEHNQFDDFENELDGISQDQDDDDIDDDKDATFNFNRFNPFLPLTSPFLLSPRAARYSTGPSIAVVDEDEEDDLRNKNKKVFGKTS